MPSLFDPIDLGAIRAPNRILMAPLTRTRADKDHVPTDLIRDHYVDRADSGLLISEATGISREGMGWPYAPGIYTEAQIEGWKPVVDAVHKAGGRIMVQLWHMGRLARQDTTGLQPISSSNLKAPYTGGGKRDPYSEPRPATLDDIKRIQDDYATATRNAIKIGFDGVQLHGANGYLIDQFTRDNTNKREDEYGGSPENRTRMLREVMERIIAEAGADRTSIRLSPNGESQGADDSNPEAVFLPVAKWLGEQNIAFLELREQNPTSLFGRSDVPKLGGKIREVFKGVLVLNQDYGFAEGQADLDSGAADAIAYGRPYIANPDLVERFRQGAALNEVNYQTVYTPGVVGYNDYPRLDALVA
jgi:N-ethylmaleimide reductase